MANAYIARRIRRSRDAAEISKRLSQNVEGVCRHYLPAGRREGRYWMVGDVAGTPGRSLYVRLFETERGRIGNWVDAATGEHGDLLDLIRLNRVHSCLNDAIAEAERFLALPPTVDDCNQRFEAQSRVRQGSPAAARRLFAASNAIDGTLGAKYLASRGIVHVADLPALRFHPRCYYRRHDKDAANTPGAFPALIAAVTDNDGTQTGTHRTWIDPSGRAKARIASPRRAMGNILGHAIRFGTCKDVMAAGEGIETMLSLREILPTLPLAAATSSSHLAALSFPATLKRLYVARDRDAAGDAAFALLNERAQAAGIELLSLMPVAGDFNDDLLALGAAVMGEMLLCQLHAADRERFPCR